MDNSLLLPPTPRYGFVFWMDAHSLEATDVVDLHDLGKLHSSKPIITGGWVMKDDEVGVSICGEFCGGSEFRNSTFVPRSMVLDVWYIKVPRKKKIKNNKMVQQLIMAAVQKKQDPSTVLAMALQESRFDPYNPLHVTTLPDSPNPKRPNLTSYAQAMDSHFGEDNFDARHPWKQKWEDAAEALDLEAHPDTEIINHALNILAQKRQQQQGKPENIQIQAYNGLGMIRPPQGKTYYGQSKPIDMRKTPLYGDRIIDLRENVIKKNPELVALLKAITNNHDQ